MSKDKHVENKNVENKNEEVGRGARVRVRAREVSPSIYFHFQHFYLSTYVPFLFSTFLFSTKLGGIVYCFFFSLFLYSPTVIYSLFVTIKARTLNTFGQYHSRINKITISCSGTRLVKYNI